MSKKRKLEKFSQIREFSNVFECYNPVEPRLQMGDEFVEMQGKWRENYFKNHREIVLELACGGGEYTIALARREPLQNFIGVDLKGNRIWKGARVALAENLENAAFLRTRIEVLANFFEKNEVDEIWLTFPDPFLRLSKSNKRLTSPFFLEIYRKILKPGGLVHLKTDERILYDFTLEIIANDPLCRLIFHDDDIHSKPLPMEILGVKTYYEAKDIAGENKVKYIRFTIN